MTDLPRDLALLRSDLELARLPRGRPRIALVAIAVAVTITAAAVAATRYLGGPAPAHVNATFRQLIADPRWPVKPVLRETAKIVAFSPHGVLYAAQAKDGGGECLEFVSTHGASYFVGCGLHTDPDYRLTLIQPYPFHGSARTQPPYVIVGRADPSRQVIARFTDGGSEHVTFGLRGYFVYEPHRQMAARRGEMTLLYKDRAGSTTDARHVPPQLLTDARGKPVKEVTGYTASPLARYASFTIIAENQTTILAGSAPIRNGRFTWTVPHQSTNNYTVYVLLVDSRFQPLTPDHDAAPVPDPSFWRKAKTDAPR
jgi:hypothetical protein